MDRQPLLAKETQIGLDRNSQLLLLKRSICVGSEGAVLALHACKANEILVGTFERGLPLIIRAAPFSGGPGA